MSMKKSDVKDVTIRQVGDVTNISTSDTAKSGTSNGTGDVMKPDGSEGNISGAKQGPTPGSVPSAYGLPLGPGGDDSGNAQPSDGPAKSANSVQTSPNGQGVNWPDGADRTSAGGVKMAGDSLVLKTGGKVTFPAGANTSAKVMDVETFG